MAHSAFEMTVTDVFLSLLKKMRDHAGFSTTHFYVTTLAFSEGRREGGGKDTL